MYIKQMIIQGFKSYKDQTEIEPFSPGTNVIVGRNGSGKSNFFAAIQFVLYDRYTTMGREDRQALLHEGHGSAVMTAYVEIIFDNSDGRFPTGKDEVILRRTIGLKKDEYSLDRKNATKNDVMNLLEAAGFSRSNPYYIVPQGRVKALTNMKDPERLNVLKEVAGTQVYEARRTESLKIMTETNNKRAKIDESLEYIQERLAELEEEKEELRGYQEKDRDRRCLEYALFHGEQTGFSAALDELEETRQEGIEGADSRFQQYQEDEQAVSKIEFQIKQLEKQIESFNRERKDLEDDKRQYAKAQARAELELKNLESGRSASENAKNQHQKSLKDVKDNIATKEKALTKLVPEFTKRKAKEDEVRRNMEAAEGARNRLYDKQGRTQQFKNKAARDDWLKEQIAELSSSLAEQKASRINADEEVKAVQSEIKKLEVDIEAIRERFDGWEGSRQALQDEVTSAKTDLEKLQDEQKILRREQDKLLSTQEEVRQERDRAEKDLSHSMDRATSQGLAMVRRLKIERNIPGAYGTLAELFEVSEGFKVAAEQTAGNSLFHYVVDNEKTASMLADELYKRKGGRITFMPLAQLYPRNAKLPHASDAVPLINKLKFEKKYEKAISQVFGKTVVCPSLSVAAQYARSHGCNAITTDGDTANKKGAMTGGYHDPRQSRLDAVRNVNKWRDEYENVKERCEQIEQELKEKAIEITSALGQEQVIERKFYTFQDSYDPLRREFSSKKHQLEKQREQLEATERRKQQIERLQNEHGESLTALEAELVSDFKKSLSANEERQLEQFGTTVQELHQEWSELSNSRREVESSKQSLETELQTLRQRLDQLNSQELDPEVNSSSGNIKTVKKELQKIQTSAASVEKKLQEAETEIEQAEVKIVGLKKQHAQVGERMEELSVSMSKEARKLEKYASRKALLTAQAAEAAKNIRELGVLPDEAFEKYTNAEHSVIDKKLKKVNQALKGFKNVNKKAFEQYNSFTSQRDGLIKRRKELDDSQKSIQDLVEVLDQRKDEAIERTFKQVSKEFAQIFEKLVPAGKGRLIIQRRTDRRRDDDESENENRESVENYTGVGIAVSFNSKHDDQQRIQQLSGGQKALCAISLIFAIQQCDPAPFYLFDEVDAALDAQYRTAVAQHLETISNQAKVGAENGGVGAQFICTTFRPEMLLVADKCYGVTFHNKTSGIDAVSREEALSFVEGEGPR